MLIWIRHTFVRQALVDGVPIEVVSELAGHASIDTTQDPGGAVDAESGCGLISTMYAKIHA